MNICSKCYLLLEANINLQLGNLIQNQVDRTARIICKDKLSEAERLFRSTLDKIHNFDWDNTDVIPDEESAENSKMSDGNDDGKTNTTVNQRAVRKILTAREQDVKIEITKGRKGRNVAKPAAKEHCTTSNGIKRVTRSRYRSSNQSTASSCDSEDYTMTSAGADQMESVPRIDHPGNGISCTCSNMKCWRCLLIYVSKSGLLTNYIDIRWELCCRRISTGLLISIGMLDPPGYVYIYMYIHIA